MVYLLHFTQPYIAAKRNPLAQRVQIVRHYIGFTDDALDQRLADHRAGRGAHIVNVLKHAGIGFACVRTWPGDRSDERRLKSRHNAARLCPVCREQATVIDVDLSTVEAIEY